MGLKWAIAYTNRLIRSVLNLSSSAIAACATRLLASTVQWKLGLDIVWCETIQYIMIYFLTIHDIYHDNWEESFEVNMANNKW